VQIVGDALAFLFLYHYLRLYAFLLQLDIPLVVPDNRYDKKNDHNSYQYRYNDNRVK